MTCVFECVVTGTLFIIFKSFPSCIISCAIHVSTYVPCVMLREGECQSAVKEGCIEAYKYSTVSVVGLWWDLRAGWRSRMKGPFGRVKDGGPVEGVFFGVFGVLL